VQRPLLRLVRSIPRLARISRRDISLNITSLLEDKAWGPHIDADQIGVAGHSQGGFTSLWIGGAKINPELYLAYQTFWRNNPVVPAHLREQLPLDSGPARDVHDNRVKAIFAMAPGDLPSFGMDEAGLRQLTIPIYIIVGARDTQAPPRENSEFAAKYIPRVRLDVMSGQVDHEIFVNECDAPGRTPGRRPALMLPTSIAPSGTTISAMPR
jgi:predicted dienelactone hydrolase